MNDDTTPKELPSKSKKSPSLSHQIIFSSISVLIIAAASGGAYLWQHHKVTTESADIKSLENKNAQLKKDNSSLNEQVSVLNKNLQTALSKANSQPSASIDTSSITQNPTSNLVINDVKQVPGDTVNRYTKSSDTYWVVDFTIYNNATSTQTYYLNQANSYFKGVGSTGNIILPYFIGEGIGWESSTILPGGSEKGILLFDFNALLNVSKIQWQAPDSSQPVTLVLPSPS